jgi:hypothetical protein
VESAMVTGCALSGEGRSEAGMGITVADFNGDQRPELFVTNFEHESNRVYSQTPTGGFIDESVRWELPSLSLPLLGFGVQAADFNGDGLMDVFIANGHINDNRSEGRPYQMPAQLLANVGRHRFQQIDGGPYFRSTGLGRGVALLDFNKDRKIDIAVVHQDKPLALLQNTAPHPELLEIRLLGIQSNRDAVGAIIDVATDRGVSRQWNTGTSGFMATNERCFRFHVPAAGVSRIDITWPAGHVTTIHPEQGASSLLIREDGRSFANPL